MVKIQAIGFQWVHVIFSVIMLGIWGVPGFSQDLSGTSPLEGRTIQYVIQADGISGTVYVDEIKINDFKWLGKSPLSGTIAFRHYDDRNFTIDDLQISQFDSQGKETVMFSDDFEREQLGDTWGYAPLGSGDANPEDIEIFQGELISESIGETAIDGIAYPDVNLEFMGKKTVFQFVVTARWGETDYNPGIIIGTKQFGLLFEMIEDDEGYPFALATWGRNQDAWTNGMGISDRTLDKVEKYENAGLLPVEGNRFRYVVGPDAKNGSLFIGNYMIGTFTWLNDPLSGAMGGFGFRRYGNRGNRIDNVMITQIDEQGKEIILFSDDFERTELGDRWNLIPLEEGMDAGDFFIDNGALVSANSTGKQGILFPNFSCTLEGNVTTFLFTLLERGTETAYNPGIVIGDDAYGLLVELVDDNGLPAIYDSWGRLGGVWSSGVGESLTYEDFEYIETKIKDWMMY